MSFEIKNGILRKYIGSDLVVDIPDDVTEIDTYAFKGRDDILEITLPEGVVEVCSYAFAECKGLEKVSILGNPILGKGVFYKCENLKELNTTRGLKEFGQGTFAGCPKLESTELSGKKFELYTLTGDRSLDEISYLRDIDISKELYSWEDYKRITSEILDYTLIYSTEDYNELEGPEIPEVHERNTPILDDMLIVKDGHFVACALEKEHTVYVNNKLEMHKSLVLLKPGAKSVRIHSIDGNHLPFYMYSYTDAFLRKRDEPNKLVGTVNSIHKIVP